MVMQEMGSRTTAAAEAAAAAEAQRMAEVEITAREEGGEAASFGGLGYTAAAAFAGAR